MSICRSIGRRGRRIAVRALPSGGSQCSWARCSCSQCLCSCRRPNAALPLTNPPAFNFTNDENGADDQPGQKDLSAQAVAVPAPGDLWVSWKWDVTSLSGGNTGDGCALFDTDNDSKVNFAICVTIQGNPAVQAPVSPRVYTCGDGKVDRCTSTVRRSRRSTRPARRTPTRPTRSTAARRTRRRSATSTSPTSAARARPTWSTPARTRRSSRRRDPSDCVLIPRDAFLKITKVASPNTGSFPFWLGLTTDASPHGVVHRRGSQSSSFIPIRSDVKYKLKEDVPANWAIDGTPSCTGASGSGSSNGTFSVDTISGHRREPGQPDHLHVQRRPADRRDRDHQAALRHDHRARGRALHDRRLGRPRDRRERQGVRRRPLDRLARGDRDPGAERP